MDKVELEWRPRQPLMLKEWLELEYSAELSRDGLGCYPRHLATEPRSAGCRRSHVIARVSAAEGRAVPPAVGTTGGGGCAPREPPGEAASGGVLEEAEGGDGGDGQAGGELLRYCRELWKEGWSVFAGNVSAAHGSGESPGRWRSRRSRRRPSAP